MYDIDSIFEWGELRFFYTINFAMNGPVSTLDWSILRLTLNNELSIMFPNTALKWWMIRLTPDKWNVLTLKLGSTKMMYERAHFQTVIPGFFDRLTLHWGGLELTTSHETDDVRFNWCEKNVCCSSLPNNLVPYALKCVVRIGSSEVCLETFPRSINITYSFSWQEERK